MAAILRKKAGILHLILSPHLLVCGRFYHVNRAVFCLGKIVSEAARLNCNNFHHFSRQHKPRCLLIIPAPRLCFHSGEPRVRTPSNNTVGHNELSVPEISSAKPKLKCLLSEAGFTEALDVSQFLKSHDKTSR